MKVAIMAGGTGGHIFPGLAVANELDKQGIKVVWLGAIGGMEEKLVKQHGIPIKLLAIKALRGKGLKGLMTMPLKLFSATRAATKFFQQEQVNAVISMGGYVAGPGGLAAKLKGIPLLVHEQNSKFGMTNKYLSKWANKVLTGFNLNGLYNSQWVGNPVREEIENHSKFENKSSRINILIIGGSLGANSLNVRVPELLNPLLKAGKIAVVHQCGKNHKDKTMQQYQASNKLKVVEFINNMVDAYSWADFVIARAGALTIAEINATGLAAILIPYPHAVDNHQTLNAKNIVDHNAGYIWQEKQDIAKLDKLILDFVTNKKLRQAMAVNSKKLHKQNAALKVAEICLEIAK
ncbi:UDP-N-acetylglucosamine--N-acetylmuramyl-(pentapeptide) pyrophosphoryl-undecaprenol N-acetylglucosamine transferase [hydrothermal vent metagenome]|uniref:UDP-N-acetylglucosamine--N-acetylmuramyl-(Pentapeptide) pyrophosphoryl-undecaprenol N-acetylglucosamine transferase n=1 Tax=hydrothermal vent metagenome TaxID=652676 RepID=A0A3B0VWS4_9ZZZZ